MYACIYIYCIYIDLSIYVYIYTHMYIDIFKCRLYKCTFTHTVTEPTTYLCGIFIDKLYTIASTHLQICIHIYIDSHTHTNADACIYRYMYIYLIYTYTFRSFYTSKLLWIYSICINMHLCIPENMYMYLYLCM